jgi:hypothetical protein
MNLVGSVTRASEALVTNARLRKLHCNKMRCNIENIFNITTHIIAMRRIRGANEISLKGHIIRMALKDRWKL